MLQGNPKIKDTILCYRNEDDGTTILRVNGELAEISDKDGFIHKLANEMNGKKNYLELVEIASQFGKTSDETSEILKSFSEYKFIEDTTKNNPLDSYTNERWSRNMDFFGSLSSYEQNKFLFQKIISDSKLTLLGCGGLGTHVLLELASVGFKNITLVDFDKIELSNLNRQILYKESDIGSTKVYKAKERILEYYPNANIESVDLKMNSSDSVKNVIIGSDLVICVADKPRNQMIEWLNDACVSEKIPFINGGLDIRRSVFYSVIPGKSGCVSCWKKNVANRQGIDSKILAMDKNLNIEYKAPAPAFSPLVAVTAGIMVAEAVNIITGIKKPELTNKLKAFSFDSLSIDISEEWDIQEDCDCHQR